MPSVWRSPATSATGSSTLASRLLLSRGVEQPPEHLGLALAGEPGEPDHLAAIGGELAPVGLRRRPRSRARRAGRPLRAAAAARVAAAPFATLPIAATSESRVKPAAGRSATTLPSRMTMMRLAVERISPRRCEMRMHGAAARDEAADEGEELPGDMRVERGGRLVEDDERQRRVGDREGARDLHHLPAADREVADDVARRDAVAGKISSSLSRISRPERCRQPKPCSPAWKTRAFSATVRFGQSESSWKTQRMPWRCAPHHVVAAVRSSPPHADRAAVGAQRPGEHMHQRRFAGAVVADEAEAFARLQRRDRPRQARGRRRNSFRRRPALRSVQPPPPSRARRSLGTNVSSCPDLIRASIP